jgi:hypothetical protein
MRLMFSTGRFRQLDCCYLQCGRSGQVTDGVGTVGNLAACKSINPCRFHIIFTIAVPGTPPLSYQWRFGGTKISGATGSAFTLSNMEPAQFRLSSNRISKVGAHPISTQVLAWPTILEAAIGPNRCWGSESVSGARRGCP